MTFLFYSAKVNEVFNTVFKYMEGYTVLYIPNILSHTFYLSKIKIFM